MKKAMFIVSDELEADEEIVPATGLETTFSFQLTDEEYNELYRVWAHNEFYLDGHTCDWCMHEPLHDRIDSAARIVLARVSPDWMYCYWRLSKDTEEAF